MQTALPQLAREGMGSGSYASAYQYDQLHRIVSASNYYVYPGGNWKDGSVASNTTAYGSSYSYDANGNILSLSRYAGGNQIDDLSYHYTYDVDPAQLPEVSSQAIGQLYNNQLQYVTDGVGAATVGDLTSQPGQDGAVALYSQNYVYDEIGNLVRDSSEQIEEIVWNVQGKVQEVRFEAGKAGPDALKYEYDPMGNRLAKKKLYVDGPVDIRSEGQFHIRDLQVNVLAVYQFNEEDIAVVEDIDSLYLEELHLYGLGPFGNLEKSLSFKVSG
ncbi:hypothetical protein SapgrDRAFT_0248 [Saprospira grandis DSM 2844]|uniref:RHS repeat protein n=1 Tax=Saprospira grandis DSM 2844 TaxID=694433 RepID=J0XSU9_9BACT|nr:hypothetical protein [Saprospira grandis]EJF52001.1 hypothetical protein SapgrDRAFT_0248 [Saprospira grandis DSM 2844]